MSSDWQVKRGDALRSKITATLKNAAGAAIDLTYVSTAQLVAQRFDGVVLSRSGAIETPPTDGKVSYTFVAADWGSEPTKFAAGAYQVEWVLTYADGGRLTVPTTTPMVLEIYEDLS